jgi:gamma-glutamylputrescine oxidase
MSKTSPHNALAPSAEHAPSYYAASLTEHASGPALCDDSSVHVCVIGGGFTGICAALNLAKRGIGVMLLEQSRLAWGASGRNGGQAHIGLRRDQDWLERHMGGADARRLWDLALDARAYLDTLIQDYGIQCDFRPGLLHADHKPGYAADTQRYVERLRNDYAYPHIRFVERAEVRELVATDGYFSGSFDERGGHLHPMNYALGLARAAVSHGARLHEGSEVLRIERRGTGWLVRTRHAQVRADKVLLACNGYLRGIAHEVERHVMPINNYIAVTEPLCEGRAPSTIRGGFAVSDSRFVVNYFRMTADHRLLFGGGENYRYRFPPDIRAFVRRHALKIFPQLHSTRWDYGWGGTLAITPTRMPFIRELQPGFYNASGFSGLGVLLAPYCGKILAEAIAGERANFELLARVPVPSFPGGPALRWPTLLAAMSWYALRDRLFT